MTKRNLQASEIRQTDGSILNLAPGVYFANAYEVNYFSGGSSEKFNQYMGPYMMHWFMINYSSIMAMIVTILWLIW